MVADEEKQGPAEKVQEEQEWTAPALQQPSLSKVKDFPQHVKICKADKKSPIKAHQNEQLDPAHKAIQPRENFQRNQAQWEKLVSRNASQYMQYQSIA